MGTKERFPQEYLNRNQKLAPLRVTERKSLTKQKENSKLMITCEEGESTVSGTPKESRVR